MGSLPPKCTLPPLSLKLEVFPALADPQGSRWLCTQPVLVNWVLGSKEATLQCSVLQLSFSKTLS